MHSFMPLVHEILKEDEENVPDNEMRLAFVKSGYILGRYISTLRNADLESGCIREPGEYTIRL